MSIQYMGFECASGQTIKTGKETGRPQGNSLWTSRPWTHVAYNEGGLTTDRLRQVVEQNHQKLKLRNRSERGLQLKDIRLAYDDHSLLALQILGDLSDEVNSGSKIQNLHFISSFPNSCFFGEVLGQKGLENIRHWRTKLAQPDLVEEIQKLERRMEQHGYRVTSWMGSPCNQPLLYRLVELCGLFNETYRSGIASDGVGETRARIFIYHCRRDWQC